MPFEKGLSIDVHMPSMRKGFCNVFLEECLVSFKMYRDGKKYICFVRYVKSLTIIMICPLVLWFWFAHDHKLLLDIVYKGS